ncbi:MAG: PhoH family protein [Halothiobacillaceae bacterium]
MINAKRSRRCLFVLDTNVLMHDPTALFRFMEHDIYLPMVVLEELDAGKKGASETARNVRQVSRFLDEMLVEVDLADISSGLPLHSPFATDDKLRACNGRLFFQTEAETARLPDGIAGNRADNQILGVTLSLREQIQDRDVILVSKDINLRIKATALGLPAEDYHSDQVLDDVNLLYTGVESLPADFWEVHGRSLESWQEEGRSFYRLSGPMTAHWLVNQCLWLKGEPPFEALVRELDPGNGSAVVETVHNFRHPRHTVWGINARNPEQNFALNLLMDPEIDFVTLLGQAGTGKTLLALAAGLAQTLDNNLYGEIIMTRVTVPVAEDIGFLPGTEEEKMTPWMGALMDNLEVLSKVDQGSGSWERQATNDLLSSRIKIRSLNFMRGRTFQNKYVIIDEAQNLTAKQMKTLLTRAGPGTKMICLGNVAQIDTPYLSETTSGLTYVVDRFKGWPHGAHITLRRGERSRLAEFAEENL